MLRFKRLEPVRGELADLVLVGKLVDAHSEVLEELLAQLGVLLSWKNESNVRFELNVDPEVLEEGEDE